MPAQVRSNDTLLRSLLLSEVLNFVVRARSCPGVTRIALVGSLTTSKQQPKDADVLVSVTDDADLTVLAKAGRMLKGKAQSKNSGADIFIANLEGEYIGRVCHWRECRPFIRVACDARHCGRRQYLHDDLDDVTLNAKVVREPPVELWPKVVRRIAVPADVDAQLLRSLEALEAEQ
ncbi:MAG: DUF6932 family protein [Pyrinomonadaceae bacterium]